MTASTDTDLKALIEKLDKKVDDKFDKINQKIEDIKISLATTKNDLVWLKWLFGIFSTILTLLLSLLITVLFKLIN